MRFDRDRLRALAQARRAVGAFNTYGSHITEAVLVAAESAGRPVLLQTSPARNGERPDARLMAQTVAAASHCSVPVGVHLDHCRDFEQLKLALDLGYSSVMIDASHLPLEENIEQVRRTVAMAAPYDAWVEAELGAIPGDEHRSTGAQAASSMTDPAQAQRLVRETGTHALAVAIGNVHGYTALPARLDINRLREITEAVTVPLVLHGASGVVTEDLVSAVRTGVAKVNVNTELREAFLTHLDVAEALGSGWNFRSAFQPAEAAASAVALEKILLLAEEPNRS